MFAMAGEKFSYPGYAVLPAPEQNFLPKNLALNKKIHLIIF
jgi:hypothetical protein